MKVIFVAPKVNIPKDLIRRLEKYSQVYCF